MKWTEGHVWVAENILIQSSSFFTYKYVVMKQDKAVRWEQGPNRVADLEILPDRSQNRGGISLQTSLNKSRSIDSRHSGMRSQFSSSQALKQVLLKDEWEQFTIRFSIHSRFDSDAEEGSHPLQRTDGSCMRIMGSLPELTRSGSVGSGPQQLKSCARKFRWMYDKFGQEMQPWECLVKIHVSKLTETNDIIYSYSKCTGGSQAEILYEREPSRLLQIQPAETYKGELGIQKSSQWKNWDKVWIVNGHIEKTDGNFLGDLFLTRVGETGASFGNFPLDEPDVHKLKASGVNCVLNLMMKSEYRQRGVNWNKLKDLYRLKGIKVQRLQVNDMREKELVSSLFHASQLLHKLVD